MPPHPPTVFQHLLPRIQTVNPRDSLLDLGCDFSRSLRRLLCLALVPSALAAATCARADVAVNTHEYAIQTFRTDNGLPQNNATAVIQTSRGYIWVGTYNGIAQFDGIRFKVLDSANTQGLANNRVTALHEDVQQTIWIGHDTGEITRYANDTFTTITLASDWGRFPIKDFATDENGDLWALNQSGEALRIRDQHRITPHGLMAENPFVNPRVIRDSQNHTYVLRNGVLKQFTSRGYTPVDLRDPVTQPYYAGIAAARDGSLWIAGQARLRKWRDTNWVADVAPFDWSDVSVTTMLETTSGRVVIGTLLNGIYIWDPQNGWITINRHNGLPQDWVCSLWEDREQNLWAGTSGGLAILRPRRVKMFSPPDEWQGRPVYSITRSHDNSIWAATEGAGIYQLRGTNWQHYGRPAGLDNLFVWSILEDHQHTIWAGTWGGGLYRLENDRFTLQTNLIATANPVLALKESPPGTLWIGTGNGLHRYQNGNIQSFQHFGGAAAGHLRALETAPNGDLWIGSQGSGLGCLRDNQIQTFQTKDGLPSNFILSLHAETNGTLWIGTLDAGLCRYHHGAFQTINTTHGLPANIIYHIEDDHLGNLWFNSPVGLFRVSKQHLNQVADGAAKTISTLAYGTTEGLATLAGTGGFTPSGFRAPDGQLWFPNARGIAVIAPQTARANLVQPPVWIEEIIVDGQAITPTRRLPNPSGAATNTPQRSIVLPPGRHLVDLQFTGISHTSPDRVHFKYQLEGLDKNWTEAAFRRRVTYPFLPPGDYTFRVIASNSDGIWNQTGDSLTIRVQPYFWQTLWFRTILILACCLAVGSVVYAISRRRHRLKLERIARERALERERARIAQDIHDDLGASLTRIGLLSEATASDLDNPPRAATNLEQIIATTRELTRSMDEIVWAVNPRHDTLESLTNYISRFAHDFLSTAKIRCRLALPLQLPDLTVRSEVRHNLFLACKEALNNVVKHSAADEVRLNLQLTPRGIEFSITDNGHGLHHTQSKTTTDHRPAPGNGLANLERRLRQIGGHSHITSTPSQGTTVQFFVPLQQSPPVDSPQT